MRHLGRISETTTPQRIKANPAIIRRFNGSKEKRKEKKTLKIASRHKIREVEAGEIFVWPKLWQRKATAVAKRQR